MKPGHKTTEFWLVVAALVSQFITNFGIMAVGDTDHTQTLLNTTSPILLGVYILARTIVKVMGVKS